MNRKIQIYCYNDLAVMVFISSRAPLLITCSRSRDKFIYRPYISIGYPPISEISENKTKVRDEKHFSHFTSFL